MFVIFCSEQSNNNLNWGLNHVESTCPLASKQTSNLNENQCGHQFTIWLSHSFVSNTSSRLAISYHPPVIRMFQSQTLQPNLRRPKKSVDRQVFWWSAWSSSATRPLSVWPRLPKSSAVPCTWRCRMASAVPVKLPIPLCWSQCLDYVIVAICCFGDGNGVRNFEVWFVKKSLLCMVLRCFTGLFVQWCFCLNKQTKSLRSISPSR